MPYNSYYMPNVTGLEHVDHVDSRRHDAVRHVDIAVVDYDHDEDDDEHRVEIDAMTRRRRKTMQHYLMLMTTYYWMVVAVANMQPQLRPQQRLQLMDIVRVVDVCEDGRDDSLDDDGMDNLQIRWITTKKEKSKWKVNESELLDGVHTDMNPTVSLHSNYLPGYGIFICCTCCC